MKKWCLSLIFCLCFPAFSLLACSCQWVSDYFCPSVSETKEIIVVKVLKRYGNVLNPYDDFMDVEILDRLASDIVADTITVVGHDGLNCNQTLYDFMPDQQLVLGLFGDSWIEDPDNLLHYPLHDLSGCGRYYLTIHDGEVTGPIRPGVEQQSYSDFAADIMDCIDQSTSLTEPGAEDAFTLFPSPAIHHLQVEPPYPAMTWRYAIFNTSGISVGAATNEMLDNYTIDIQSLPAGVYFLQLTDGDRRFIQRFVKQ